MTEAQIKAKKNYLKKIKKVSIEFNTDTDAELIEYIEKVQGRISKQAFIKKILKEKMEAEAKAINYIMNELEFPEGFREDITINTCRNGRDVAWYFSESDEMCVYVDTLEQLTQEEIENELQ